jgi:hypothetical protein
MMATPSGSAADPWPPLPVTAFGVATLCQRVSTACGHHRVVWQEHACSALRESGRIEIAEVHS